MVKPSFMCLWLCLKHQTLDMGNTECTATASIMFSALEELWLSQGTFQRGPLVKPNSIRECMLEEPRPL